MKILIWVKKKLTTYCRLLKNNLVIQKNITYFVNYKLTIYDTI
jgi:hypothetical protein